MSHKFERSALCMAGEVTLFVQEYCELLTTGPISQDDLLI